MENQRISKKEKCLRIGDLNISLVCKRLNMDAMIPYAGMAFYQPNNHSYDIQVRLGTEYHSKKEGLVWGSDEFSEPTFLYEDKEGFDWCVKNRDGSSKIGLRISKSWNLIDVYEYKANDNGERLFKELGSLFSYSILNYYGCVLHGVVMEYEGRGILVTAESGTGKTTHTRMWRDYKNALILNGDRCLIRRIDNKWYAYGSPWSGSSGEYINRKVSVDCIVCLNRGMENSAEVCSQYESTVNLIKRVFAPHWPGALQENAIDNCIELAKEIPVVKFYCKPEYESVDVLLNKIKGIWNNENR